MDHERILMVSELEYGDIERGLRLLVNATHSAACDARRCQLREVVITGCDVAYEQAVMTYRKVIGRDPVASTATGG